MNRPIIAAMLAVAAAPALAQEPPSLGRELGPAWTSSDSGSQMSNVRARLSGGQCIVTMAYKTREGISGKTQWTYTAEQQPGHIRCTGGQWKDLSGSDRTGPVTDLIAYKGKFYWARR